MIKKIFLTIIFSFIFFETFAEINEKFLSLKKDKVNVRYGPSFDSPLKYVYKKINLPVKQIDKKENWRRIIDLKNKVLFKKPSSFSKPIARLEKGRLLVVEKCQNDWCKINTSNYSGWIKTDNVWGSIN